MNGIEKITAKIQQDAEAEVQALMAQTEEKVAAIQAQADAQAQQEREAILTRGRKGAGWPSACSAPIPVSTAVTPTGCPGSSVRKRWMYAATSPA